MKLIKLTVAAAIAFMAITSPSFAAKEKSTDKEAKEKTVTISGEAKCAKCALKESDKCQTVIQSENKKGKMVTYVLADNQVAKDFHSKVCKENKQVTVTGTAKKGEGKGKMDLAATKIEEVKSEKKSEKN